MEPRKWEVKAVAGAAGGPGREAIVALEIETESDTVEEVRQLVEALPLLLGAARSALAIIPQYLAYAETMGAKLGRGFGPTDDVGRSVEMVVWHLGTALDRAGDWRQP